MLEEDTVADKMTRKLSGPIHVSLPASVAYDLPSLQKSISLLAEGLGCKTCFSGADCTFHFERNYVINERFELASGPSVSHEYRAAFASPSQVTQLARVQLHPTINRNIEKIKEVTAKVAGELGHVGCCSGFDLSFGEEVERIFYADAKANVQAIGGARGE